MTDPTNPGGWPDANSPVTTPDTLADACGVQIAAPQSRLCRNGCAMLTPAEIAAQVAAARAEEREACVALALGRVACSDEREGYMCHRNWYEIAAAIRARGTP